MTFVTFGLEHTLPPQGVGQQSSPVQQHGRSGPQYLDHEPCTTCGISGHCAAARYVITHVTISATKTDEGKRDMASVTLFGQSGQAGSGNSITVPPLC